MKSKSGMIGIVGRPNVGGVHPTNALVGEKIAIVTNKPQTTRNRICAVVNRERAASSSSWTPRPAQGPHPPGDYMVKVVKRAWPTWTRCFCWWSRSPSAGRRRS